jgi:hypothetical protein
MPVAIVTTDFPEGVGPDTYDSVNGELDLSSDPAAGLIFHWAGFVDGKWTISDVWESREAYDRFHAERLFRQPRRPPESTRPSAPSRPSPSIPSTTTSRRPDASASRRGGGASRAVSV